MRDGERGHMYSVGDSIGGRPNFDSDHGLWRRFGGWGRGLWCRSGGAYDSDDSLVRIPAWVIVVHVLSFVVLSALLLWSTLELAVS